jgi:hypothetical protein
VKIDLNANVPENDQENIQISNIQEFAISSEESKIFLYNLNQGREEAIHTLQDQDNVV